MERRFLSALSDHRDRQGAFATKWEGWISPRGRAVNIVGRVYVSHPAETHRVEDRVGCYAILYRASPQSLYTAYIGSSEHLRSELEARIDEWGIEEATFPFTAVYIPSLAVAREYEEDLIRYYAPPWNQKFFK